MPQNFLSDLGALKVGFSQGSVLGLLQFKLYVNGFPLRINSSLKATIFADDTSVIIFSKYDNSCRVLNLVLYSKWFATKKLDLNMDKRNVIKFITNNLLLDAFSIGYKEKYVKGTVNTQLLG